MNFPIPSVSFDKSYPRSVVTRNCRNTFIPNIFRYFNYIKNNFIIKFKEVDLEFPKFSERGLFEVN